MGLLTHTTCNIYYSKTYQPSLAKVGIQTFNLHTRHVVLVTRLNIHTKFEVVLRETSNNRPNRETLKNLLLIQTGYFISNVVTLQHLITQIK